MNTLTNSDRQKLLTILENRFQNNRIQHQDIEWTEIRSILEEKDNKVWSLYEMERTGGEPDVIGVDEVTGEYLYCDCSAESPTGRRNCCYDPEALDSRKNNKPVTSAVAMANEMGIEILTEAQYRKLQTYGEFDTKTSSWIQTPAAIRKLGGALFADRRYDHVFVYHNGASSYYSSRGFRGMLNM